MQPCAVFLGLRSDQDIKFAAPTSTLARSSILSLMAARLPLEVRNCCNWSWQTSQKWSAKSAFRNFGYQPQCAARDLAGTTDLALVGRDRSGLLRSACPAYLYEFDDLIA
jgi:hypothetical protein